MMPPTHLWNIDAPLVPLRGGQRNVVFRSEAAGPVVFKSCRRSEAAVQWLLPLLDRAEAAGFVVPRPQVSRDGRYVVEGWTCEPFIDGTAMPAEELGALRPALEVFHAQAHDLPQRPGFLPSQALLRDTQGGDVDLSLMPPDLVSACRAAWAALQARAETVVHGDLFAENVLRCPDGRFALIDWDEARRDVAAFDLVHLGPPDAVLHRAHLAWEAACSWGLELDYARRKADQLMTLT